MNTKHTISKCTLIIGGIRSGKSAFGETFALDNINSDHAFKPFYLATGVAIDHEMQNRIDDHRKRRDPAWETIEVEDKLANTISDLNNVEHLLLIDCMSVWLTNQMVHIGYNNLDAINARIDALVKSCKTSHANIILISCEVGQATIALEPMTRAFIDINGAMNQRLAEIAKTVYIVQAGLPHILKS